MMVKETKETTRTTTTSNSSTPVDLSTTLAGVRLTACLYNASGPRSGTAAALHKIAQSSSGAVLTKSATLVAQTGNPQPRTYHVPVAVDRGDVVVLYSPASFNSEGLPNNGIDYYISAETIQETMQDCPDRNKPYIVSLSGKFLADNLEMIRRTVIAANSSTTTKRIDSIELNLACPNVIGKPIIAYDVEQMDDILTQVGNTLQSLQESEQMHIVIPPLGVKLPPYIDFDQLERAAAVLNRHHSVVRYVVAINTLGNALVVDDTARMPCIRSNDGYAGLSGPVLKYTALANVRKLRACLRDDIDVVGCGGVTTGRDVYELLLCGATAVQTATTHWKEGPMCFDRILTELTFILQENGHSSVADVVGTLQPWSAEGAAQARRLRDDKSLKDRNDETTNSASSSSELQFYKLLSMVLTVVVAILAANSMFASPPPLLPSES